MLRAERVGFEPTKVLPLLAFQASALVHYATSPNICVAHLKIISAVKYFDQTELIVWQGGSYEKFELLEVLFQGVFLAGAVENDGRMVHRYDVDFAVMQTRLDELAV